MDGMLSQDEINALLSGMSLGDEENASDNGDAAAADAAVADAGPQQEEVLTPEEEDALGEISNISMGSAATALSALIGQRVDITTPKVTYATWESLSEQYDRPCVLMHISYKEGLDGNNILVLRENDVKIITDLMMGGAGVASDEPLTELHLSAIGEAMNQMMGSAATSMSTLLERKIDISPPVADVIDFTDTTPGVDMDFAKRFVKVAFKLDIGTLINSEIMQLYPLNFARELYHKFADASAPAEPEPQPSAPAPEPQPMPQAPQAAPMPDSGMQGMAQQPMGYPQQSMMGMPQQPMGYPQQPMGMPQQPMGYPQPMMYMPAPDVNVQPTTFQPFDPNVSSLVQRENINLIKDVPLEVSVELGRTRKSISDILEFAPGTIVELDKIAGEPTDVYVNGKLVAKGEVVVIEESFGVRITEVLK